MSNKNEEFLVMFQEVTSPENAHLEILEESTGDKKRGGTKFKAILQEAEVGNQNKRLYKREALQEGIKLIAPRLHNGTYFGEMDHPNTTDPNRFVSVLYKNVSHRSLDLSWNGNLLESTCQTTSNSTGKDLEALIVEDRIPVGFSLRAMGKTRPDPVRGLTEVTGNMRLVCWDAVTNPSHSNALTQHILESADVSAMLLDNSERVKLLSESYEMDLVEMNLDDTKRIKYDPADNAVIICSGNSCMKSFLESHVRNEFRAAFANIAK